MKTISRAHWVQMSEFDKGVLLAAVTAEIEARGLVPEEHRAVFLRLLGEAPSEGQAVAYMNRYLARLGRG